MLNSFLLVDAVLIMVGMVVILALVGYLVYRHFYVKQPVGVLPTFEVEFAIINWIMLVFAGCTALYVLPFIGLALYAGFH
jgi:hypothetical protein